MIGHNVLSRGDSQSRAGLGPVWSCPLFALYSFPKVFFQDADTFTEMPRGTVIVFAALFAIASATEVNKCGTGEKFENSNQVSISGCDVPPCKLKRGTKHTIEEKFTAEFDVQNVMTSVNAAVLGVPLPFVGVDGTPACENISHLDGSPAGCSLKKGVEYIYKREFPVLQIYPTISMVIHYALMDGNRTIACFEVPAKIVK